MCEEILDRRKISGLVTIAIRIHSALHISHSRPTNAFFMSTGPRDLPSASNHPDNIARSSSVIVLDSDDRTAYYDASKTAKHVLQQFFHAVQSESDSIKSAKCLICRMVIKQSTESTFNYKRHIERKHKMEMDQWQIELEMKKQVELKKQVKVRESFVRKSE
jgi:hypothetical protein